MNAAREQRELEIAARAVAEAMVTPTREQGLKSSSSLDHLRSCMSTVLIVLDDAIERFSASRSRAPALELILSADFCWQILRALGHKSGDDLTWVEESLPADWTESDREIGDRRFARQRQIAENAKWVFSLHSALRHPATESDDLIALLRDPVDAGVGNKLCCAAKEIRQVWLSVQVRLDRL